MVVLYPIKQSLYYGFSGNFLEMWRRIRVSKRDLFIASLAGWAASYYTFYPYIHTANSNSTVEKVEENLSSTLNSQEANTKTQTQALQRD